MNVLLVVPWDTEHGGVVSVVDNLTRGLQEQGHNVTVFHPFGPLLLRERITKLGRTGVQLRLCMPLGGGIRGILRTALWPALFVPVLLQLLWLLRNRRVQIVNLHYVIDNYFYFAICRYVLPIRLVTSVHGGDAFDGDKPLPRYSRFFRRVIEASDVIVTPSDTYRKKLDDVFPGLRHKTQFIHNGIDPAHFKPAEHAAQSVSRYILCVADFHEYKAVDVLLSAAGPLLAEDGSLNLVLAGDGPLRKQLQTFAWSLGITPRTKFLGHQTGSEVAQLMRDCAVMVLPSRMETFGLVLIEAMACKAPVVATRVGGIPEIIEHGRSGLLVPPDDSQALTAAIRRVLNDEALRVALAADGYSRVMERFCVSHNSSAYISAFSSLVGGVPRQPAIAPDPTRDAVAR